MPAAQGPIHVKRQAKRKQARKPPASVFGPIGRADASLRRPVQQHNQRARRQVQRRVVSAPRGDVASSGGGYGLKRAAPTVKRELTAIHRRQAQVRDTKGATDLHRAAAYLQTHPEVLHPSHPKHRGALAFVDAALSGKLSAGAVRFAEGAAGAAVHAGYGAARKTRYLVPGTALAALVPEQFAKNAARDLVDIPANVIPSLYVPAREAVTGHPGRAAGMLAQPFIDTAKHPLRSLVQHPVGTVLLASGAKGAVGRSAGKALRSAPSETLRKAGSTERPAAARVVPGTALREEHPYSKDVLTKAGQVISDRVKERRQGHRSVRHLTPSEIERRVDEHHAASEDIRRLHRGQVVQEAQTAIRRVPGKRGRVKPTAAVTLATQNIARPGADLMVYLEEIRREGKGLTGSRRAANREAQAQIVKAIRARKPEVAIETAKRYAKLSVRLQEELAKRGIIGRGMSAHARQVAAEARGTSAGVVEDPAFVTHAPGQRGARNFYVPTHEPPRVITEPRTGAAVRSGTMDVHPDVLVEQAARSQGLIDAADRYGAFVREFAVRGRGGKVKALSSYKRAQEVARELMFDKQGHPIAGAIPMRPVRLNPFMGRGAQLQALLENANQEHGRLGITDAVHSALSGDPEAVGPWTLVPDVAARRMQDHVRATGAGSSATGRVANLYGSLFRRNVLAFSPKWLTGNIVEAATRSLIAHAGPRSYATGRAVLKRAEARDRAAGEELRARTVAGGHYSLGRRSSVTTKAEHFAGTRLAKVAQGLGRFGRTPGPKQLVGLYHAYTDFVFNSLNGRIESQFQTAMLGKALRDSPLMADHVVKLSARALDEAARGATNTNTMAQLGRAVDDMYGRYGKFSPGMRRFIAAYTPFIAWTLNAVKFLSIVLPRDHPVLTSVLASANQASQEWRKQHGLVLDPFGSKGQLPDFLQGSIPGKGDSKLRISRYVPAGVAAGGVEGLADLVLPQWRDILNAAQGQDWRGKPLNADHSDPSQAQRVAAAAGAFVELAIPGLSIAKASSGGSLRNRLDPTKFTAGKKSSSAATSKAVTPNGAAQQILARSRGHATRAPETSEAQKILAKSRR